MCTIPSVDLQNSYQLNAQQIQSIGDALRAWGFVNLVGHGIADQKIQNAYQVAREVFALGEQAKQQYEDKEGGRQRGYTPFLLEKAKNASLGDLKEFWHIGRDLPADHPYVHNQQMRPNLFPTEVSAFADIMRDLFSELDRLAHVILGAIESYLGYDQGALQELAQDGNSILRVLHYPDLADVDTRGRVRAAAHEDINLLTLLPAATQPGLELLTRQGEWMPVNAPLGSIICDTGDMMNLLTEGELPATTHRVVNPENAVSGARLSMPFFMHPHPNARLKPFHLDSNNPGITAHEFLTQRLQENSLI